MLLENSPCKGCGTSGRNLVETNYHTLVCCKCGIENPGYMLPAETWRGPMDVLVPQQNYTRVKRFLKYLNRAGKSQTASSVPPDTWKYLLSRGPYRSPGQIVRTLKSAGRSLKKKCYDSLPFMCEHLTTLRVPSLNEQDKARAMVAFGRLDAAYQKGGPFVSYLFALEYILVHIGRADLLPFLNKIQCRKRRARYTLRLDKIYT